ncbi:MAG: holo-ACP synthase [Clostridia bacterium]
MRTGIDIVKTVRMEGIVSKNNLGKVFSALEIDFCRNKPRPIESFAGIYAAKEAFLKAVGIGISKMDVFLDIEVLHEESGRPFLQISGDCKEFVLGKSVDVSISHEKEYAIAVCIIF